MSDEGVLFPAAEVAALRHNAGAVEKGLAEAVRAGLEARTLIAEDMGLVGAAMVAARKLDAADTSTASNSGYLVAQLLTPYRETLQALRLPAALTPVPAPPPAESQTSAPDWLRDTFGSAE